MRGRAGFSVGIAALLWSGTMLAASPPAFAQNAVSDTHLAEDKAPRGLQPAFGRTLSFLADLYVSGRIGTASVDRHLVEYDRILHSAGPDAIVAVSEPVPEQNASEEQPDGELARVIYERAAAYGYRGALVGLGDLYLRGVLLPHDAAKAYASYSMASEQGSLEGRLRAAELMIRAKERHATSPRAWRHCMRLPRPTIAACWRDLPNCAFRAGYRNRPALPSPPCARPH